jgi:plasmid stabilization system protein ParE
MRLRYTARAAADIEAIADYLGNYRVDREADEIVVLTIQHSSRRRAFTDR